MKDYDIKDRILISATDEISSHDLAARFQIPHERVYRLISDMSKRGHITQLSLRGFYENYKFKRTEDGEHFMLNHGYRNEYKINELSSSRKAFIEWATLVFSLLTVCIGIWQGVLTNKMSKLEDENKKLQTKVDSLISSRPGSVTKLDTTMRK